MCISSPGFQARFFFPVKLKTISTFLCIISSLLLPTLEKLPKEQHKWRAHVIFFIFLFLFSKNKITIPVFFSDFVFLVHQFIACKHCVGKYIIHIFCFDSVSHLMHLKILRIDSLIVYSWSTSIHLRLWVLGLYDFRLFLLVKIFV